MVCDYTCFVHADPTSAEPYLVLHAVPGDVAGVIVAEIEAHYDVTGAYIEGPAWVYDHNGDSLSTVRKLSVDYHYDTVIVPGYETGAQP
ncbi:MAG: hypothetical protein SGBAC_011202 [Bacillariaceae sp.]